MQEAFNERRYVGSRETFAFICYDASQSININSYKTRFNTDILKINLNLYTLISLINGIWDVINDTFTGIVVDKTRTRWGKFKPYLIVFAIPSCILGSLYWLSPSFLNTANQYDATKFFFFLFLAVTNESIETFRSIAQTGLQSTLTPNSDERVRLLTLAKCFSPIVDNIPGIAMNVLYDIAKSGKTGFTIGTLYRGMGVGTSIFGAAMAMFFFVIAKERVAQTEERPKIIEGFKTIFRNKPIRLYILADFLGSFSLSTSQSFYFIDVLGYASLATIREVPAVPLTFISYGLVAWARRTFSTRLLWIMASNFDNFYNITVFLLGCIGGTGKNGWFRNKTNMMIILVFLEFFRKAPWGIRNVMPSEILYECIDYCEWKDGYRSEGVILSTKSLITKLVSNSTSSVTTSVMSAIGYDINAEKQSDSTLFGIFATSFLLPALTGIFSIIPRLMFKMPKEMRDEMYLELQQRRKLVHESANEIQAAEK